MATAWKNCKEDRLKNAIKQFCCWTKLFPFNGITVCNLKHVSHVSMLKIKELVEVSA